MTTRTQKVEASLSYALGALSLDDKSSSKSNEEHNIDQEVDAAQIALQSTLYPKIYKLSDFVHRVRGLQTSPLQTKTVHLTGSVKLHGTHADIVFVSATSEDFRLQSRNRKSLVPGNEDNAGFAAHIAGVGQRRILALRDRVVARYMELNPRTQIDGEITVAGEWCGEGIQKNAAVSQLPKFLVIISICILGRWVEDSKYADICDEDVGIFNIGRIGFFEHELNMDDVRASEMEIKRLVDEIERECPFAKALGATGHGEGIVWKATEYCGDADLWFKSKGDLLAVSHSSKLPASAVDMENRERVENFAKAIVTGPRLEQGWENSSQKDASGIGSFLKWIVNDCVIEEKREMEELKISKKKLSSAIVAIAKPWFWEKLKEGM